MYHASTMRNAQKSYKIFVQYYVLHGASSMRYDKGTTGTHQTTGGNTMKQYKGYYIDKVIFNSEHDIDEFIRNQAIKAYKDAVEMFAIHSTIENSLWCDEKAERLVNQFGFTWDQVEELEIETLKEIA